jgi:hypothetical protein
MTIDHKAAALMELRSERADVAAHAEKLERERADLRFRLGQLDGEIAPLTARLHQLDSVIAPLTALVSGSEDTPTTRSAPKELAEAGTSAPSEIPEDEDGWKVPEVFRRYMPKGGEGKRKRLRSTLMVSDVVDKLGEPVTRDHLREAFFEHFGREDIQRFWDRPDNALNTAIMRARDEDLIVEIKVDGKPALYAGHFRNSETGEPAFPPIHIEEDN